MRLPLAEVLNIFWRMLVICWWSAVLFNYTLVSIFIELFILSVSFLIGLPLLESP